MGSCLKMERKRIGFLAGDRDKRFRDWPLATEVGRLSVRRPSSCDRNEVW